MTEEQLDAITKKHNLSFAVSLPTYDGVSEIPTVYLECYAEIPEYGYYCLSSRIEDLTITSDVIEELLEDWNSNNPDHALWEWQQGFIDKGQCIPQDKYLGMADSLEEVHARFWDLICDLYLNHLEDDEADEENTDLLDLLS